MNRAYQTLFAAASFPIRCKRWNPPVDLRFAIYDLRLQKAKMK